MRADLLRSHPPPSSCSSPPSPLRPGRCCVAVCCYLHDYTFVESGNAIHLSHFVHSGRGKKGRARSTGTSIHADTHGGPGEEGARDGVPAIDKGTQRGRHRRPGLRSILGASQLAIHHRSVDTENSASEGRGVLKAHPPVSYQRRSIGFRCTSTARLALDVRDGLATRLCSVVGRPGALKTGTSARAPWKQAAEEAQERAPLALELELRHPRASQRGAGHVSSLVPKTRQRDSSRRMFARRTLDFLSFR